MTAGQLQELVAWARETARAARSADGAEPVSCSLQIQRCSDAALDVAEGEGGRRVSIRAVKGQAFDIVTLPCSAPGQAGGGRLEIVFYGLHRGSPP